MPAPRSPRSLAAQLLAKHGAAALPMVEGRLATYARVVNDWTRPLTTTTAMRTLWWCAVAEILRRPATAPTS